MKSVVLISWGLLVGAVLGGSAFAEEPDPYFVFKQVKIEELSETPFETLTSHLDLYDDPVFVLGYGPSKADPSPGSWLDETTHANLVLDQIINFGKKIWGVIESNKPVVNVSIDSANALPQGANSWLAVAGWKAPVSKLYKVTYANLLGMTVVEVSYRILFTAGGNVNGKGRYLSHVSVAPAKISAAWGYSLDVKAFVPSVTNAGTHEDPIGAAQLQVEWKVNTVMKSEQGSQSYYIRGDGEFMDLNAASTP